MADVIEPTEIEKLNESITELANELTAYITAVDAKIGELSMSISTNQSEAANQVAASQKIQEEKEKINEELSVVKQKSEETQDEINAKVKELEKLNTELEKTKVDNAKLTTEKDALRVELQNVSDVAETMKKVVVQYEELEKNYDLLQKELIDATSLNATAVNELNVKIAAVEEQRNALAKERDELNTKLQQQITEAEKKTEQLQNDLKNANDLSVTSIEALNGNLTRMSALTSDILSLTEEKEKADKEKSALQTEMTNLTTKNAECEARIIALNKQIFDANTQIMKLRAQLVDAQTRITGTAQTRITGTAQPNNTGTAQTNNIGTAQTNIVPNIDNAQTGTSSANEFGSNRTGSNGMIPPGNNFNTIARTAATVNKGKMSLNDNSLPPIKPRNPLEKGIQNAQALPNASIATNDEIDKAINSIDEKDIESVQYGISNLNNLIKANKLALTTINDNEPAKKVPINNNIFKAQNHITHLENDILPDLQIVQLSKSKGGKKYTKKHHQRHTKKQTRKSRKKTSHKKTHKSKAPKSKPHNKRTYKHKRTIKRQ